VTALLLAFQIIAFVPRAHAATPRAQVTPGEATPAQATPSQATPSQAAVAAEEARIPLVAPGDDDPEAHIPPAARARGRVSREATPPPENLEELFDLVDTAGEDWYLGWNNEGGDLAWGESLVLAAYLEMYRATGLTSDLDRFVSRADPILANTDQARSVIDYAGRSGPVWRSGSRYGYATLPLPGADGEPVGMLTANRRLFNHETQAEARLGSRAGTFLIAIRNPRFRVVEMYDRLDSDPRSRDFWVTRVNARSTLVYASSVRARTDRTRVIPFARRVFDPTFVVHVASTGLIAYPLARFARLVSEETSLAGAYGTAAVRYGTAARDAVAFHDSDWVEEGMEGYYRYPPASPIWCDGAGLPYNQNLIMGRALLELSRLTGDITLRTRAEMIARHFQSGLGLSYVRGYIWPYWWGQGYTGWDAMTSPSVNTPVYPGHRASEDIGHGAFDLDFVADAVDAGAVFTRADTARVANTVLITMRNGDDFHNRVDGRSIGGMIENRLRAARWIRLARVSRDASEALAPIVRSEASTGYPTGNLLYTVALLAVTEKEDAAEPTASLAAPAVTLTEPTRTAVGGWASLASAAGSETVSRWYCVDGRARATLVGPAGTRLVNTRLLPDGPRRFEVVAADELGRARVDGRSVVVDNTGPRVRWVSTPGLVTPNSDADRDVATWSFFSSEPGRREVLVTTGSGRVVARPAVWENARPGIKPVSLDGRGLAGRSLPDGAYLVRAVATDELGNKTRLAARPLVVSRLLKWGLSRTRTVTVGARARVGFYVGRRSTVTGTLRDARGRMVARVLPPSLLAPGWHAAVVQRVVAGRRLPAGVYTLVIAAPDGRTVVTLSRPVTFR
jgi:hypothetical protein